MTNVIKLHVPRNYMDGVNCHPEQLFLLRWRLVVADDVSIYGDWTPAWKYPSLSLALSEYADRIERVHIEGLRLSTQIIMTMLTIEGHSFAHINYKAGKVNEEEPEVIGIQVRDRDGNCYLVLRDGTYYHEVNHVANNHK